MPVTIALAARINHAMIPAACPLPKPRTTYSSSPPAEGYRAPNLANEYPCSPATAPAIRKEIQTAAPATSPADPSRAKIPAPTMAPTPMNAAWRTFSLGVVPVASAAAFVTSTSLLSSDPEADGTERTGDHAPPRVGWYDEGAAGTPSSARVA